MKRVVLLSNMRERWNGIRRRIAAASAQFYTPREIRALVLFLLIGVAVLFFRFGKHIYFTWFPAHRNPKEILAQRKADSLYFALSDAANRRDSLFFSLPADSLLPVAVQRAKARPHSKADGLSPYSISLNLGTREDLLRLPSVGPASAELILAYRTERGSFRTLDELKNVHGFGTTRFDKMKRYLKLN
jgi:competence ComEA-like helix-hairpin-helix protein